MVNQLEPRHGVVSQPPEPRDIGCHSRIVIAQLRRRGHVQKRKMRGIECTFHGMRPVALNQPLGDEAVRGRHEPRFELRHAYRTRALGAQIGPDHAGKLCGGTGPDTHLAV